LADLYLDFRSHETAKPLIGWMMALTIRGGIRSCQGRATKIGSGDPAPLVGTRVDDHGRRFIVGFAEFFNGHLRSQTALFSEVR